MTNPMAGIASNGKAAWVFQTAVISGSESGYEPV